MSRIASGTRAAATPRRSVIAAAGAGLIGTTLAACGKDSKPQPTKAGVAERDDAERMTWKQARKRLEEGNLRFVEGRSAHPDQTSSRRKRLNTAGQKPYACVLACADSRVPPEVIFDQGLGDLFVVRSAGQVVDTAVLGSLQYAVAELATPLIVVLGHSKCGAVQATADALQQRSSASGTEVDTLIAAITPSVLEAEELGAGEKDLLSVAVDSNVERVVAQLRQAKVLGVAVKSRRLRIVGAVYDLGAGEVLFL